MVLFRFFEEHREFWKVFGRLCLVSFVFRKSVFLDVNKNVLESFGGRGCRILIVFVGN